MLDKIRKAKAHVLFNQLLESASALADTLRKDAKAFAECEKTLREKIHFYQPEAHVKKVTKKPFGFVMELGGCNYVFTYTDEESEYKRVE